MKKVVFIMGPTGAGKTELSIFLAKHFNGEIVSADSVQIYKNLDIGSAKITKEEMKGVKHYGIDLIEPEKEFSVFDFVEFTKKKIDEISGKGKIPFVVGGTGLYIKALTHGYNFGGTEKDKALRGQLENLAKEKGNDFLFKCLKEKDPALAEKTDKNNTVRLVRALEIATQKGEKSESQVEFEPLLIGLTLERTKLYENINKRVDKMLEKGLIEEVQVLKDKGLNETNQSMRAIGYKEVLAMLNGEIDQKQMVELVKQHSRNYAKRQMTFLRGMEEIKFVNVEDKNAAKQNLIKLIGDFLNE